MTPVAVLAILVTSGEAHGPVSAAMFAAASEVVGASDGVQLIETEALSDAEALRVEHALPVRAVVQLGWRDPERAHAWLSLHAARTDRWIDREIVFATTDTPPERGRTLGFAIASMLPEGDPSLAPAPIEAVPEPTPRAAPTAAAAATDRYAASLAFLAGAGLGGPASGLGGDAEVERFVSSRVSVGLSIAARLGRITDLDARELTSSGGFGAALWPVIPTATGRLGVALRADALLLYHAVSHADARGATEWKGQALPGAVVKLEGVCRLGGAIDLLLGAGAEVAFGTIDVTVVPAPPSGGSAHIPVLRAVAEGGLRARF
jgi:hypothetical protein